jgi:hypothetical protein
MATKYFTYYFFPSACVCPWMLPYTVLTSSFDYPPTDIAGREELRSKQRQIADELHKSVGAEKVMVFAFGDRTREKSDLVLNDSFSKVVQFPSHYAQSQVLQLEMLYDICQTASLWLGSQTSQCAEDFLPKRLEAKNVLLLHSEGDFPLVSFIVACIQTFRGRATGGIEVSQTT